MDCWSDALNIPWALLKESEIAKVSHFITNPYQTGLSIDHFLNKNWLNQGNIIFENKDHDKFSLSHTLALIHQSLVGQLPKSSVVNQVLRNVDMEHIAACDVDQIYSALVQCYMREKGLDTLILGGSCGGSKITLDPFSNELDNLSTSFRMTTQWRNHLKLSKDYRDDPNLCHCSAASGPHFHCPGIDKETKRPCNHPIIVGEGTTSCPHCGKGKTC